MEKTYSRRSDATRAAKKSGDNFEVYEVDGRWAWRLVPAPAQPAVAADVLKHAAATMKPTAERAMRSNVRCITWDAKRRVAAVQGCGRLSLLRDMLRDAAPFPVTRFGQRRINGVWHVWGVA